MAKDVDLFVAAMTGVKPLQGRPSVKGAALPRPQAEKPLKPQKISSGRLGVTKKPIPPLSADSHDFDRDIGRALSRGKRRPDGKLDLHGMTLAAAERAVARFLEDAVEQDWRVVLVVTGKGLRQDGDRVVGGRIRDEFVGWLNRADNRARVRGVRAAHPHHGGSGAYYVLLRRRSSASSRSLRSIPQR
jgi:DNA-nicking Smr family endonuclease